MPYFSLRHQRWGGSQVSPGDPIADTRDMTSLVRGRYVMYAPDGYRIEKLKGKWIAVPDNAAPPMVEMKSVEVAAPEPKPLELEKTPEPSEPPRPPKASKKKTKGRKQWGSRGQ